ncbi:MAG: hypothetical protein ACYS67_03670 [Planctomycetota bacterium]
MARRCFTITSLISSVLLGFTLVLTIAAVWLNPWKQRLTITDSFHIGLGFQDDLIGRIVFFNDSKYGPYQGSIMGLSDKEGNLLYEGGRARPIRKCLWSVGDYSICHVDYVNEQGEPVLKRRACDFPGIYYRYFVWPDTSLWTLAVSFLYPLLLFALLPALWIGRKLMQRRHYTKPKSQPQQITPSDG